MTGHPVKEWLLFAVAWLLLVLPTVRLTATRSAPPAPPPAAAATRLVETFASLRFSEQPLSFSLQQGGRELWGSAAPEVEMDGDVRIVVDHGQAEVLVHVRWPEGDRGSRVVELTLAPDGLEERTEHAWGGEALEEIFTYDWSNP